MGQWKKAWGYIPIDWGVLVGEAEDFTQKVRMRNNLNGTAVKIKFTNLYDGDALLLEQVNIGKLDRNSGQITEWREVTYQGNGKIEILPGHAFYSDDIPFSVKETDDFVAAIYFKGKHKFYGLCQTWNAESWQSSFFKGNRMEDIQTEGIPTVEMFPFFTEDVYACNGAFGISDLQVLTEDEVLSVACFGDSTTHMSYYFDPLQDMFYKEHPGKIALYNCGISGNRILFDTCRSEESIGHGKHLGKAGMTRFAEDVYGDTWPDIVFLMEGVNDCTHAMHFHVDSEVPTGAMLFDGLKSMIEKAHEKGSKIYISTVMPFGCYEEPYREQAEGIRQDLNALIREHKDIADGFVDLDEVVRKPEDIHFMKDGFHLGDGTHPSKECGKAIADAIVELFKREGF